MSPLETKLRVLPTLEVMSQKEAQNFYELGPTPEMTLKFASRVIEGIGSEHLTTQWSQELVSGLPQLETAILTRRYQEGVQVSRELANQILSGREFGWWNYQEYRERLQGLRDVTSAGQFVNVLGSYALQRVANFGSLMVPNFPDLFSEPNPIFLDALTNATVTNFGAYPLHLEAAGVINRLTGGTQCPPYHPGPLMEEAARSVINILPINQEGAKVAWFTAGGDAVSVAIAAAEVYATKVHGENGVRQVVFFKEAYHGNVECRAGRATSGINEMFHKEDRHSIELEFPNQDSEVEPCLDQIKQLIAQKKVSCLVFEPTQGDGGGVHMHQDFFNQMVQLSLDTQTPLICDEVQSGFGRSGRVFDVEYLLDGWKVSPYVKEQGYPETPPMIFALAKSLTNGVVPGSAAVFPKEYAVLGRAQGLNTYSAHPTCLAAAIATCEMMSPQLLDVVNHKRRVFDAAIAPYLTSESNIQAIRGHGLHLFAAMTGSRTNEIVQMELLARKRILTGTTARDTLRIHAPLNAPDEVWQAIGTSVGQVARDVSHGQISPETLDILNTGGPSGLAAR